MLRSRIRSIPPSGVSPNQVFADFVIADNGNEIDTVVTGVLAPDGVTILPALATRSIGRRRFTLLP
jgi:hypothetical protein